MGNNSTDEVRTFENFPLLFDQKENCHNMNVLGKCIVKNLENCEDPTTANIVGSLFKFINKENNCVEEKSSGDKLKASINFVGPLLFVICVKFIV